MMKTAREKDCWCVCVCVCVRERKKVSKRTSDRKIDWAIVWDPLRVREQPRKEIISNTEGQLRRVVGELWTNTSGQKLLIIRYISIILKKLTTGCEKKIFALLQNLYICVLTFYQIPTFFTI